MTEKLSELTKVERLILPADIGTADVTSTRFIAAKGNKRFRGILTTAACTSGQTTFIQLMQATDATGTAAKALTDPLTYTAPSGGGNPTSEVEANIDALDSANGFLFVGIKAGSSANGKVGAALLECDPDYLPAS